MGASIVVDLDTSTHQYSDDRTAGLGVRARILPSPAVVKCFGASTSNQYLPDPKIRRRTAPWPRPSPASPIALALVLFGNSEDDRKPAGIGF